jgi:hypothetical protein
MVLTLTSNLLLTVLSFSYSLVLSPIEYAIARNNEEMLTILLELAEQENMKALEQSKEMLLDALESLPDLSLDVNFTSNSKYSSYIRAFPNTNLYKVSTLLSSRFIRKEVH